MRFLPKDKISKTVLVVSDFHMGAGKIVNNKRNYLEDFDSDEDFIDFLDYYSSGEYANRNVELVINGDMFDLLAVPFVNRFDDEFWSEKAALERFQLVLSAHSEVMSALDKFTSCKNKKLVFIVGNHDAELYFTSLQKCLLEKFNENVREKLCIVVDSPDGYKPHDGVEIRHGNEYEKANWIDYENAVIEDKNGEKYLLPPWSSYFVTRVINKFKEERDYINGVKPVRSLIIHGLIYDTFFALRFSVSAISYFFMIHFVQYFKISKNIKKIFEYIREELKLFRDYESLVGDMLKENTDTKVLILGHTHLPIYRPYSNGSVFINTGTWTRMFNMNLSRRRESLLLTYAQVDIIESNYSKNSKYGSCDSIETALNIWKGRNNSPFLTY